jgi:hypothetical protein
LIVGVNSWCHTTQAVPNCWDGDVFSTVQASKWLGLAAGRVDEKIEIAGEVLDVGPEL